MKTSKMVSYEIFLSLLLFISLYNAQELITTNTGLQFEDTETVNNCNSKAEIGTLLSVHYSGYFVNGTKFDSSYDRNEPLTLILGECPTTLIRGWVEGLRGMCEGEKRKLIIPPSLGYGEEGKGIIPGNTTLQFDVELTKLYENANKDEFQEIRKKFNC